MNRVAPATIRVASAARAPVSQRREAVAGGIKVEILASGTSIPL
jgi:hypothetical protein